MSGERYLVHEGRIQTWALECHPVDHCNLRCDGCCPLSPHQAESFLDPARLRQDLERLEPVLRPSVFRLTGGEPLLHPDLLELIAVARESGISEVVQITTNGTHLLAAPDALFEAVDRVRVSWYTSAPLSEKTIDRIRERCRTGSAELAIREYASFQELDPPEGERDLAWAERAFAGCWIRWRCHLVYGGRFYTCTRPPHLEPVLRARGVDRALAKRDGVALDDPFLADSLRRYLERDSPLDSCRHCLGNEGAWRPHAQLPVVRVPRRQVER